MIEEPRCFSRDCRHFQGVEQRGPNEADQILVCPAYPNGIPDRIAYGTELHLIAQDDQVPNGVVYEKGSR